MAIEEIRRLRLADPFRPFVIHLADGRRFSVPRAEFLALSPTGRTIAVFMPDDTFEIVDVPSVKRLSVNSKRSTRKRATGR